MGRGRGGAGGRGGTARGAAGGGAAPVTPAAPAVPRTAVFGTQGIPTATTARGTRGVAIVRNRAGVAQRGSLTDANNELRLRRADWLNEANLAARRQANPNTPRNVANSGRVQPRDAQDRVAGYRAAFTTGRMARSGSVAFRTGERAAMADLRNY